MAILYPGPLVLSDARLHLGRGPLDPLRVEDLRPLTPLHSVGHSSINLHQSAKTLPTHPMRLLPLQLRTKVMPWV